MPTMMRDTIKRHADFATGDDAPTARCAYFLVRTKPAKYPEDARYGMIVTKKTFKHAVDRNRAKRVLRDWIAHNEDMMQNAWDYIFVIRRDILIADRQSGRVAMKKALNYLRKEISNAR